MAQYLPAVEDDRVPRVVTQYEPGTQAALDQHMLHPGRGFGRLMQLADVASWRRFERKLARDAHAIVVFTERDRHAVEQLNRAATPIVRIPFGVEPLGGAPLRPALDPVPTSRPRLLFVGNFIHPPNVDAAMRLVTCIFPLIRAGQPDAVLEIVGGDPPAELVRRAGEGVVVTGFVPSVVPYLESATLVVIPLRTGGGMRVKVVEALAAGKVVVASRLAFEGVDVVDGEQAVFAETDEEFRDRIVELLASSDRRLAIAARAREWAEANLDWKRSIERYEELYFSLLRRNGYGTSDRKPVRALPPAESPLG